MNDNTTGGASKQSSEGGASRESRTYIVQNGDTLSKIAGQYYGDSNRYMDIFNANTDKLSSPDKIQVGQELVIPE